MSSKYKVWVARPLFDEVLERLSRQVEVVAETVQRKLSPEQVRERLADVDGALVGLTDRIDAKALAGNTRLKVVANLGVGHDNFDLGAMTAAGVLACNTPGVLDNTVADHAWALLTGAARRVGAAERWLRAGEWARTPMRFDDWLGADLHGRTLGILGMGRVGQAIARRAAGFDMPVIYHNRSRLDPGIEEACNARWVDKPELLRTSDHLVLTLPFNEANRHAVGAAELAAMRKHAVLVNIARGGIVDDAALAAALREGRIAAAGLDVFEGEPTVHPDLLAQDNVLLTPHIGSASAATRRAMAMKAVDNVLAVLGDPPRDPPSPLNPDVLKRSA